MNKIGKRIYSHRLAKDLSQREVASRVGCSSAHLSLIENGKVSPSIALLEKIAATLKVSVVNIISAGVKKEPIVMKVSHRKKVNIRDWKANISQLVTTTKGKTIQPFYTVVEPGGGSGEKYTHTGQEFGLVIKGELTLHIGESIFNVGPGDSFYYDSKLPHYWENEGNENVEVFWVDSPPNW